MAEEEEEAALRSRLAALPPRVPRYSLAGHADLGRVLHVVDGNTLDVAMAVPNCGLPGDLAPIFEYRLRLYGIDAPQRAPKKAKGFREDLRALHGAAGRRVKTYLAALLSSRLVWVCVVGTDVFGRPLARVFLEKGGPALNDAMLDEGLARKHSDAKPPSSWRKHDLQAALERAEALQGALRAASAECKGGDA